MTLMKAVGVKQNWKVKGSKNQNNELKGTKMLRRGGAEENWESGDSSLWFDTASVNFHITRSNLIHCWSDNSFK